jgi:opacity protein-like surface antigen
MTNKKRGLALLIAVGTLGQSFAAFAQTERFYLGVSAGTAQAKERCNEPQTSCEDSDQAWKFFGGYYFNRNIAVELAIGYLGEVERRGLTSLGAPFNSSVESRALELLGVAALPIGNRFSVYGKLGFYRAETYAAILDDTERNADLTFGAGVKLDLYRDVAVRGEWQRYKDVGTTVTGKADVDVLAAGLLLQW